MWPSLDYQRRHLWEVPVVWSQYRLFLLEALQGKEARLSNYHERCYLRWPRWWAAQWMPKSELIGWINSFGGFTRSMSVKSWSERWTHSGCRWRRWRCTIINQRTSWSRKEEPGKEEPRLHFSGELHNSLWVPPHLAVVAWLFLLLAIIAFSKM